MAIAQKSSTISQPKKTSQITLAIQVNGCMGLDHGDVWVSNAQISEYVSLGIGSKQKLQQTKGCCLQVGTKIIIFCKLSTGVKTNFKILHCKFQRLQAKRNADDAHEHPNCSEDICYEQCPTGCKYPKDSSNCQDRLIIRPDYQALDIVPHAADRRSHIGIWTDWCRSLAAKQRGVRDLPRTFALARESLVAHTLA